MPPRRTTSAGSLRPLPAARLTAPPPPGELSKRGLRGLEASGTDGQGAGESLGSRLAVTQTCHRPASDLSFPQGTTGGVGYRRDRDPDSPRPARLLCKELGGTAPPLLAGSPEPASAGPFLSAAAPS